MRCLCENTKLVGIFQEGGRESGLCHMGEGSAVQWKRGYGVVRLSSLLVFKKMP